MIVELKKTKITNSIVNQSLSASCRLYYDWENYNILGWCLIKSGKQLIRFVLLQNIKTGQILKLVYFSTVEDIKLKKENVQRGSNEEGFTFLSVYQISIYFYDVSRTIPILRQSEQTDKEMEDIVEKIKEFYNIVREKGQIYL